MTSCLRDFKIFLKKKIPSRLLKVSEKIKSMVRSVTTSGSQIFWRLGICKSIQGVRAKSTHRVFFYNSRPLLSLYLMEFTLVNTNKPLTKNFHKPLTSIEAKGRNLIGLAF